jgi:putative transposase
VVTPPPGYWGLGNTPFAREAAYAEMVHAGLDAGRMHAFERLALTGWPLGSPGFLAELEQLGGRRAAPRPAGRPKKHFVRPD